MIADAEAAAIGGSDFQFVVVSSALLLEVLFIRLMDVLESVILLWRGLPDIGLS